MHFYLWRGGGSIVLLQDKIATHLPNVEEKVGEEESDEPDSKRPKLEFEDDPAEEAEKEKRKQQNKEMFYYRDLLGEHCKMKDLYFMLKHNNQDVPKGEVSLYTILYLIFYMKE